MAADPTEIRIHDGTYESAREICKWFGPEAGYAFHAESDSWCVVIEVIADDQVDYDWYGDASMIERPAGKTFELPDVRLEDLNRLTLNQAQKTVELLTA